MSSRILSKRRQCWCRSMLFTLEECELMYLFNSQFAEHYVATRADDERITPPRVKTIIAYSSQRDSIDIKGVPLPKASGYVEPSLAAHNSVGHSISAIGGGRDELAISAMNHHVRLADPTHDLPPILSEQASSTAHTSAFVILSISCVAAFLVSLTLYAVRYMYRFTRSRVLLRTSAGAVELVPRAEQYTDEEQGGLNDDGRGLFDWKLDSEEMERRRDGEFEFEYDVAGPQPVSDTELGIAVTWPMEEDPLIDLMDDPDMTLVQRDLLKFEDAPELSSDNEDEGDDPSEYQFQFYDAISSPATPNPGFTPIPEIVLPNEANKEDGEYVYPDPPLPATTVVLTPSSDPPIPELTLTPAPEPDSSPVALPIVIHRVPSRRTLQLQLQMREANLTPVSRPAWSIRAGEDTSLFVTPPSPTSASTTHSPVSMARMLPPASSSVSGPDSLQASSSPIDALTAAPIASLTPARRPRSYRSPMPEFDLALAMQLRPGLGIGADPAWMVRFLMAMFGWFTVLLTSKEARESKIREMRRQRVSVVGAGS